MPPASSTIVARLSPPGKSAIACLGLAGPRAWESVRSLFRRPNQQPLPESPSAPCLFFGSLGDVQSGADDVVLFVRQIEPFVLLEIHCHGGPEVIRLLESQLAERGVEVLSAENWNAAIDDRAEILDILSRCPTTRTAAIALDQLHGAFERQLSADNLVRLRELIPAGEHLVRPFKIVVTGEPNVGKSSLVNALAGFTRSVVSPTPGTTRDVVATTIALDGWPIELIDTAGLRETTDELEADGIARARAASARADLVLRVVDAAAPSHRIAFSELVVANKIDQHPHAPSRDEDVRVSALTGEGIDRLVEAIVQRLVPAPPRPGDAVPISANQRRICLEGATATQRCKDEDRG